MKKNKKFRILRHDFNQKFNIAEKALAYIVRKYKEYLEKEYPELIEPYDYYVESFKESIYDHINQVTKDDTE